MSMSKAISKPTSNETTVLILDFLLQKHILAWRHNTLPVPIVREGIHIGYRPAVKVGLPDIMGIIPPSGRFLGIEIKTGKDRLRPEQKAFLLQAIACGGLCFVVKDYEDFVKKFDKGLSSIL